MCVDRSCSETSTYLSYLLTFKKILPSETSKRVITTYTRGTEWRGVAVAVATVALVAGAW